MQPTWILVADHARARLFSPNQDAGALTELKDFVNPEGMHPAQAYSHERSPRTFESVGAARHAIEPHTSAEEKVARRFAHELAEALEHGRVEQRFERLLLVAPPRFLGTLQEVLNKHVRACVSAHLDKDLTLLPREQILPHLTPLLSRHDDGIQASSRHPAK